MGLPEYGATVTLNHWQNSSTSEVVPLSTLPGTKCYVLVPATKMIPHRHTGVVIDYSDKCTCLVKASESQPRNPTSTATPTRLNDLRSASRILSIYYSAGSLLMPSSHMYSLFRLRKYVDRCHVGLQPKDVGC